MGENSVNINKKNSILLARNTPVGIVVGAAGFLGSHLVEMLLQKNIQVIGIDDFSTGKREHLNEATKNRNFHLITTEAQNLELDTDRIDYIFITAGYDWSLKAILEIAKKYNAKIVFVSSIDLYDRKPEKNLKWLYSAEESIAVFADKEKINARVLRLASVYGPRMNFDHLEPMDRLIKASLEGELQKDSSVSDFSTRALYIDDAVILIIKSMFIGSTALKIFDGALYQPIKVADVKQILMDPLWYENKGFKLPELPPWTTPNLEKTIKELHWKSETDLIKGLKKTITYFNGREVSLDSKTETKEDIKQLKIIHKEEDLVEKITESRVEKKNKTFRNPISISNLGLFLALAVITYALIIPIISLGLGFYILRTNLEGAKVYIGKGEFDKSSEAITRAKQGLSLTQDFVDSTNVIRQSGVLKSEFNSLDKLISSSDLVTETTAHINLGTKNLYDSLKLISGNGEGDLNKFLGNAAVEFSVADDNLSRAQVILNEDEFKKSLPQFLKTRIDNLGNNLSSYSILVKNGKVLSSLLPQLIAIDGKKSYLVLLQNNNELRPTGGFIGSLARIDFESGKLKKIDVNDVYSVDGNLQLHVEPPKEIKEDLNQKDWFLRDSNFEPDFPTSARQAAWFYNKETGILVDGVVGLNLASMEDLLNVVGPLNLVDYNEKITSDNLFEKTIAHSEQGFFPGSESKKSFLTALSNDLFNKLFFLPNQNWSGIAASLGKSLNTKELMVYLSDTKLFSYLVSENWAGVLPRGTDSKAGELEDFLAPVEANLGANKANYYLDRSYLLTTTIGKEGEVSHKLKINYINKSPGNTWPAGIYKNRLRVYLPFGTKLNKASWGESDITKQVSVFTDYGRTGYSVLLELEPKSEQSLILDYQLPVSLNFKDNKTLYKLNIIKQSGTIKDPFVWKITYPINYKISSNDAQNIGPQEQDISTDLSTDRSLEVRFAK